MLVESAVEIVRLDSRLSVPADCSPVHVVDVEDLGPTVDHPLLYRVAKIAAGYRGGRVTETVRAVRRRLVELAEYALLEGEAVHKGLASVVQPTIAGPVGAAVWVDLGDQAAIFVQMLVSLVADLVVVEGELAERLSIGPPDDGFPAIAQRVPSR